ncbi:MAG: M23 family metallopeptidase [Nitratireductor sp.]
MISPSTEGLFLGEIPPLNSTSRRMPDRRRVSMRWLSGTILTGLTSVFLMGGALYGALEGRQQLALPAQAYERDPAETSVRDTVAIGDRPGLSQVSTDSQSSVMMVSTISREGDRDIVKVRPFLNLNTPLAIAPKRELDYPTFDPLAVFAESGTAVTVSKSSDLIYGADVDSEVSIETIDFDQSDNRINRAPRQRSSDIEEVVRNAAPSLDTGATSVAALSYFDPSRFGLQDAGFLNPSGVTITAENVTRKGKYNPQDYPGIRYEERVVRVRTEARVSTILDAEGLSEEEALTLEKVLEADLGSSNFQPEDRLRIAFELPKGATEETTKQAIRVSVYRNSSHLVSIAKADDGGYVYANEPDAIPQISASAPARPLIQSGRLPAAYDAIYRAALSEGLGTSLTRQLIRIFAFDVDFNSAISPTDELQVFVSLEENEKTPTEDSEILYAAIKLGNVTRKYYRYRDADTGRIDYYDETGKSSKKFLLRQVVPNARFASPFGARWHPVLKFRKMHWGVDWAAPRGTPILAAGNGTVEKAGWSSGYGKQTVIRHANGYETSYSHQSRISDNVVPGAQVRQGQIIGYVGSTGLSTGPHCHYEVTVNGTKVDPMRIRLPQGKALKGNELTAFNLERERIDALVSNEDTDKLAQN